MAYKWCIVPQCINTSIKSPHKLFVSVPTNPKRRKMWLQLARRDPKSIVSHSNVFMCEDHFGLPNDMENYMEYHLMGSVAKVRMKPGCFPTKFECQPDRRKRSSNTTKRLYILKKRRKISIDECEKDLEERSIITKHLELGEILRGSSASPSAMSPLVRTSASPRCAGATVAGELITTAPKAQRVTYSEAYIRSKIQNHNRRKFRQKNTFSSSDEPRQKTARTRDTASKCSSNKRGESSPYKHEIVTAVVIPLFDPDSNDQCMSQWINEIEQLGVIYNWTDNVKSDFMQSRLHGMAEVWHSTLQNHDMTWTEWKTKLLEAFPKHIDFVKSLREMLARKKTPNENMTQYFYSKCMMLTQLEIFGDKAVECLIDGLPTSMQAAAREGHYHSPIELHSNFLSVVEDIKPELNLSDYDENEVNNENKYVLCVVCPEAGHTASECPRNMYNDELVCWSKSKSDTCVQEPVDSLIEVTIENEQ